MTRAHPPVLVLVAGLCSKSNSDIVRCMKPIQWTGVALVRATDAWQSSDVGVIVRARVLFSTGYWFIVPWSIAGPVVIVIHSSPPCPSIRLLCRLRLVRLM